VSYVPYLIAFFFLASALMALTAYGAITLLQALALLLLSGALGLLARYLLARDGVGVFWSGAAVTLTATMAALSFGLPLNAYGVASVVLAGLGLSALAAYLVGRRGGR
jgi:hypothetical protein